MYKYLLLFFISITGYSKQLDTIAPMNLLTDDKLEVTFTYDGEIFQIDVERLDVRFNVSREYLQRKQHLSLAERQRGKQIDTIYTKSRMFTTRKFLAERMINGIAQEENVYIISTVYGGQRYFFELFGNHSEKEREKITKIWVHSIDFYGKAYAENPQLADIGIVQSVALSLGDANKIKERSLTHDELLELVTKDATSKEMKNEILASLPDDFYTDYLVGALDQYEKFYKEIAGQSYTFDIISVETVLLREEKVRSSDFPALNNTFDIALEIAVAVEVKGDKYNVGFTLLGVNKGKLLNFMYEKF